MTEYDYSPEAYERYLATQHRIANWVDQTEQHRPHFEHAIPSIPQNAPPMHAVHMPYDPHHRSKRSPPPTHHYSQQFSHVQQPRQRFVLPPESESSDGYGEGPGPMPLPIPGTILPPQPPAFHPVVQPMLSPPHMMLPPGYMTISDYKSSRRHRSSRSHSRSRLLHTPAYHSMLSSPVSPVGQRAYQPMVGGVQLGYVTMSPQHYPVGGRHAPFMHFS